MLTGLDVGRVGCLHCHTAVTAGTAQGWDSIPQSPTEPDVGHRGLHVDTCFLTRCCLQGPSVTEMQDAVLVLQQWLRYAEDLLGFGVCVDSCFSG